MPSTAYDPIFLVPELGDSGPLTVDNLSTSDTSPPLTGTAAETGINVSVEVWTTAETPVKVWGPVVAVVQSDNTWTIPDDTVTGLSEGNVYETRASATVNGEPESATGVLVITSVSIGIYGIEYAVEYE